MRVHVGDQEKLFRSYWLPIQQALGGNLTEFVRHYLMKEGKILREAEVYFELKDRLNASTPNQAEAFLKDLHRHGLFYARFIESTGEPDNDIAERLDRIRRLKVTVSYPFLLRVFDAWDAGLLDRNQVIETLDIVESFVIRRSICNVPTNQLRRMFPPAFDATGGPGPTFVDGVRRQLAGQRCPDDKAFFTALSSEPLYSTADKNARLRLILERIEGSFAHKEPASLSLASIEHVLPQTLTPAWREAIGDGADEIAAGFVHTLGNLTLTAYNAELSNQPFSVKRKELTASHFVLNDYFQEIDDWTPTHIRMRSEALAKLALEIWPDVGRLPGSEEREQRTILRPVAVRYQGTEVPVKNWRDGFIKLLKLFEANQPGLFREIATKDSMFAVISTDPERFRRAKTQIGSAYINTHASAAQLRDWCRKIAELGGISEAEFEFVGASEDLPGNTLMPDQSAESTAAPPS